MDGQTDGQPGNINVPSVKDRADIKNMDTILIIKASTSPFVKDVFNGH